MADTEALKAKDEELEDALAKMAIPKVESKTDYTCISKDKKYLKYIYFI